MYELDKDGLDYLAFEPKQDRSRGIPRNSDVCSPSRPSLQWGLQTTQGLGVVPLLELPLGLTLQNWSFIMFDTGAISESTALAHSGVIISKLVLCIASEGGHADDNNASHFFFLYCNAAYVLYMSLAIGL